MQPERSRRLDAKHIAALDAPHLPGKLPDFEQLTIRVRPKIPFGNLDNQIESIAKKFIESNLGVDLNLSDMLVVPLALVKETSVYRVKQITKHLETNLFVAAKMTGCRYGIGKLDDGFEVRISGVSDT